MISRMKEKTAVRTYATDLLTRRRLSEKTFEIELARPESFDFVAGQRITVQVGTIERDYSLVSPPGSPALSLCIRQVKGGNLSPILAAKAIGGQIRFTGPHGYFLFRSSGRPAVFVATGTGIAPFVSMARAGCRGFMLLHGVQAPAELYYKDIFVGSAEAYVPCLSRIPNQSGPPDSFHGRVTEYIATHLSRGIYDFYLCGREEMIRDVIHLVDGCFPGSYVYTEIFY